MQNQSEDWNMWSKLQAHNHAQHKFFTEDDEIHDEQLWRRLANIVDQLNSHPGEKTSEEFPIARVSSGQGRFNTHEDERDMVITDWDPSTETFHGYGEDNEDMEVGKYDIVVITHPGGNQPSQQMNADGVPARDANTLGGLGETSEGGGSDGSSVDPMGGVSSQPDPDSLARLRGNDSPVKR